MFWSLDLAGRGVLVAPARSSLAHWRDRSNLFLACEADEAISRLRSHVEERRRAVHVRAEADLPPASPWSLPFLSRRAAPWPCEDWAQSSLVSSAGAWLRDESALTHAVAAGLSGCSADPFLMGSALHLLVPGSGGFGLIRNGLGQLASTLAEAACDLGVVLSCGLEATDILHTGRRPRGVVLADGSEVSARTIISTLDLKRTFLTLFKWEELPGPLVQRVRGFRMNGATARLLLALDRAPDLPAEADRGPIYIAPDLEDMAHAHESWRTAVIPEKPPIAIRVLTSVDPKLAPAGAATMTATIGCVPHRLFDGAWTQERRNQLKDRALSAIEAVLPGTIARVVGLDLITPSDIEDAIGCTEGDLAGGELAPDQMLGQRPWNGQARGPRTPLAGLYLAGGSTLMASLFTCASGDAAARAALADFKTGRFR